MKVGRSYQVIMLALLCLAVVPSIDARYKRARSADSFYRLLARAPYSVVLFYNISRENRRDKGMRRSMKDLEIMFRSLSKNPDYKEAELQFLRVDVARRDLMSVANRYSIQRYPTAMLFVGRESIGQRLSGKVYREQLQALINHNLRKRMQEVIKEKQKQRQRTLERARIRAYQWAAWGPYWSSPYWYGPYGYGGYRPYWRYGYGRPGFGISFGF